MDGRNTRREEADLMQSIVKTHGLEMSSNYNCDPRHITTSKDNSTGLKHPESSDRMRSQPSMQEQGSMAKSARSMQNIPQKAPMFPERESPVPVSEDLLRVRYMAPAATSPSQPRGRCPEDLMHYCVQTNSKTNSPSEASQPRRDENIRSTLLDREFELRHAQLDARLDRLTAKYLNPQYLSEYLQNTPGSGSNIDYGDTKGSGTRKAFSTPERVHPQPIIPKNSQTSVPQAKPFQHETRNHQAAPAIGSPSGSVSAISAPPSKPQDTTASPKGQSGWTPQLEFFIKNKLEQAVQAIKPVETSRPVISSPPQAQGHAAAPSTPGWQVSTVANKTRQTVPATKQMPVPNISSDAAKSSKPDAAKSADPAIVSSNEALISIKDAGTNTTAADSSPATANVSADKPTTPPNAESDLTTAKVAEDSAWTAVGEAAGDAAQAEDTARLPRGWLFSMRASGARPAGETRRRRKSDVAPSVAEKGEEGEEGAEVEEWIFVDGPPQVIAFEAM